MPFEFDPKKSAQTHAQRGIDFVEAQALWNDPDRIQYPLPFDNEVRFAVIGRIGTKTWTAIIAHRGENIRIISVRRSRKQEVTAYEKN